MLRIQAKPLVEASGLFGQLAIAVMPHAGVDSFAPDTIKHINEHIDRLIEQLRVLEAPMTLLSAERLRKHINTPGITPEQCSDYLSQLRNRLPDELSSSFLLSMTRRESDLYEPSSPLWGPLVAAQFPSIQDEISEAGKCLAFGLATACAFHSLRCLEAGILAMARCLGLPDPTRGHERSWSAILHKIKGACDAKWKPGVLHTGDGQAFQEMQAALASMQNPWRNATMHLDHSYTEAQARAVFDSVGHFMNRLAERMDEAGCPLA